MHSKHLKIGSIITDRNEFHKNLAFCEETLPHYVPKYPAKDGWVVLQGHDILGWPPPARIMQHLYVLIEKVVLDALT